MSKIKSEVEIKISYNEFLKISVKKAARLVENKGSYITVSGLTFIDRMYQKNGQLIFLCSPVFEPEENNCELFVKKIPRANLKMFEVVQNFVTMGRTSRVRLMMDFSGCNRGYCFVKYYNPQFAEEAMRVLNDSWIRPDVCLQAERSMERCRLFIANIPKELTSSEVERAFFSELKEVKKCYMFSDVEIRFCNRGYGYIEFQSHSTASAARKVIPHIMVKEWGVNRPIVNWAFPEIEIPQDIMNKVKTVFLRGLYKDITEEMLKNLVCQIVPPKNILGITHNGHFAFVLTKTRRDAEALVRTLDGFVYFGAELQATFARPRRYKAKYTHA